MYYTIYETTNKINGMKYIGKHITNDLNDDYLGSGLYLSNAIEKYGKENFEKKILFVFDNKNDMDNKEQELVTKDIISNESYYNIALGGHGGVTVLYEEHPLYKTTCDRISEVQKTRSKEMSEIVKQLHKEQKVGMYGKKQSQKQKEIVREKMTGVPKTPEAVIKQKQSLQKLFTSPNYVHPNKGRKYDENRLKKMSEETKNRPKKTCAHCNKTLDGANYARYHGENCKQKP